MILALETATEICSVAYKDRQGTVHERRTDEKGSHSENLFLFVEELMAKHRFAVTDLDAVLVSEGPGSYTGLRIGASAVKGLLFQARTPLYGIATLAGFARSAVAADDGTPGYGSIHAVIDARRVHLYHQKFNYHDGRLTADTKTAILPIEEVHEMIRKGDRMIGTGIDRLNRDALGMLRVFGKNHISARSLVALFEQGESPFVKERSPESFDPKYYSSRQVGG